MQEKIESAFVMLCLAIVVMFVVMGVYVFPNI